MVGLFIICIMACIFLMLFSVPHRGLELGWDIEDNTFRRELHYALAPPELWVRVLVSLRVCIFSLFCVGNHCEKTLANWRPWYVNVYAVTDWHAIQQRAGLELKIGPGLWGPP